VRKYFGEGAAMDGLYTAAAHSPGEPLRPLPPDLRSGPLAAAGAALHRGKRRPWTVLFAIVSVTAILHPFVLAIVDGVRYLRLDRPAAEAVTGYPERLDRDYRSLQRDLPDQPGAVAGLILLTGDRWQVVAPDGRRWRLPHAGGRLAELPSVSPDGRTLIYRAAGGHGLPAPLVMHDLVSGDRTILPDVDSTNHFAMSYYWAPDAARVFVPAGRDDDPDSSPLALGIDGSVTPVEPRGKVAGWAGPDELVWLSWLGGGERDVPVDKVEASVVSVAGDRVHTVTLRPAAPWRSSTLQFAGTHVSLDGEDVVLVDTDGSGQLLRRFSLQDGAERQAPVPVRTNRVVCPVISGGDTPVLHWQEDESAVVTVRVDAEVTPMVVANPQLDIRCLIWATEAIDGAPQGGMLGLDEAFWTWWWREALAIAGVAGVAVALTALLRWRRGRP
jgi:hypothetical protein